MALIDLSNLTAFLIIAAWAAFVWISWQRLLDGLYLIVLCLPTFLIRFQILGLPTTFLELLVVSAFVIWLIKDERYRRLNWSFQGRSFNVIPQPYRWPLLLIIVAATISAFVSPLSVAAWGLWKAYFVDAFLFLILVIYNLKDRRQAYIFLDVLGLLILELFVIGLVQKMTGLTIPNDFWAATETRRITTFLQYPNANGLLIAPVLAFYFGYLLKPDNWLKQLYKVLIIMAGLAIIIWAQTAGALVALAVAVFMVAWQWRPTRYLALASLLLLLLSPLAYSPWRQKIQLTWQNIQTQRLDLQSSSLEIRIAQWRETAALLATRPLWGAGLGGYQTLVKPYHQTSFIEIYLYPHNIFLNFWVELGFLGLVGFVWLLTIALRAVRKKTALRQTAQLNFCLLLALTALIIHGLVDVPYFKNDLSLLFMLFLGLIIANTNPNLDSRH